MASDLEFAEYVFDQIHRAGDITFRKMFGEYAFYLGNKVVAFVCDNQLFVKPTHAGRALLNTPQEAPPYPGAKNHFLIDAEIEDRDFMCQLLIATYQELPEPKPKKKKAKAL